MLVAAGAGIATVLAKRNGPASALACLAATFYLYSWATVRSLDAAAAFNSGREIIARARVPESQGATIAYEASREYQVCGTYNFYLEKDGVLLDPGGFIPPTYLGEDARRLFTPRRRSGGNGWRDGGAFCCLPTRTRRWIGPPTSRRHTTRLRGEETGVC